MVDGKNIKYANHVQLNGYLFSKPSFKELSTGLVIMSFALAQIIEKRYTFFHCICYITQLQDKMKELEKCSFVNCLGILGYSKNKGMIFKVIDLEITHQFTELDLEPPYLPQDTKYWEKY